VIDPYGAIGEAAVEVRSGGLSSSSGDEDVPDIAVAVAEDVDGGVGRSSRTGGVCSDGLECEKKDEGDDARNGSDRHAELSWVD
jgi:hypothetical protein